MAEAEAALPTARFIRAGHYALGPLDAVVAARASAALTVAALLSRVGWRVLVLEQHGVAGGAMHTFTQKNSRGAWEFDAGVNC